MSQDKIFLEKEGDSYFKRNMFKRSISKFEDFPILKLAEIFNLKPKKVLEVGASDGFLLSYMHEKHKAECCGLEPSQEAINFGKQKYPYINFFRGTADSMPFKDEEFDSVLINGVLLLIDRNQLLKSISEIDRVLADKGFLLIGDFLPPTPMKVKYHHLPNEDVWTFKQDYSKIFLSTNLYHLLGMFNLNDKNEITYQTNDTARCAVFILQKNKNQYTISEYKPT